jgi:hypothetical protein
MEEEEEEGEQWGEKQLLRDWHGGYVSAIQKPGERHKGTCDSTQTRWTKSTSGCGSESLLAAMLRCWRPC